jgi:hypothetical protein
VGYTNYQIINKYKGGVYKFIQSSKKSHKIILYLYIINNDEM